MAKQIDLGSDEEFKQNYMRLKSASKMAELYGVCKNTIKRHVKRIGLDLNQLNLGRVRDSTNQKFGKLTAIKVVGKDSIDNNIWLGRCECGNETKVSTRNLTSGNTKSCGCMASSNECTIAKMFQQNGINYEAQYTFDDLRGIGGGLLKFDFAILNNDGSLSHLIEYNGKQHYFPSAQFGG